MWRWQRKEAKRLGVLKEPKKEAPAAAHQAWDELYLLRSEVRRGSAQLSEYELARKAMIADRASKKPRPLDFQF